MSDGGAAGLLEDDGGGAGGGEGGGGGGGASGEPVLHGDGDKPAGDAGAALEVADWMKSFSGEKAGDEPSNQEWLAKTGVKDPDGLVKIARDLRRAQSESGKVKIPGENATDDERAAFREAIGAPKEAAGYEVTMPEGAEQYHLDTAVMEPLKVIAHKHGVPAPAFKEMADVFLAAAVDDAKSEVARTDTEAADQIKEWGPLAGQRKEEFRRGAQLLGLGKGDIAAIQREFGAGKTLALFAKIGELAGEDFFATGNPSQRFGIPNLEAAQAQLDGLINDAGFNNLLRAKDAAAVAKYNRAVDAVSSFKAAAARR